MVEYFPISLKSATIARPGAPAILTNVSFDLATGESWAITGPMACGKTTLLETLAGKHRLSTGSISWPGLNEDLSRLRYVSFREQSNAFSYQGHYYQQRFEFVPDPDVPTVEAFIKGNTKATAAELDAVMKRFGIEGLNDLPFLALSNGQTRRARLARALLAKPTVLLLDDPYLGLDIKGRAELDEILAQIKTESVGIVLTARERPGVCDKEYQLPGVNPELVYQDTASHSSPVNTSDVVLALKDVTVNHGPRVILNQLNWTVKRGERWALMGPNGSGKTTLLSLLCGDHPRAFGEDVSLFGRRRGTGETIWEVKARVGLVSPEFHVYFEEPLSVFQTIASGYSDTLLPPLLNELQQRRIRELMQEFGLTPVAGRLFSTLSTGQQRLALLLRALVKQPELLILDEPFQAFDEPTMQYARAWLTHKLLPTQTLIFVTHDQRELPGNITHYKVLG